MNSYKWCMSYFAIGCGVGVVVPTDKELPIDDILNVLTVSESKAIIFDKKFGEKLLEHRDRLPKGLILISMEQQRTRTAFYPLIFFSTAAITLSARAIRTTSTEMSRATK